MLFASYAIVSIVLFLYSYTQVDLNLTISEINIFQTIQKAFQHIGYFQRPQSAIIYVIIVSTLFFLYAATLFWVSQKKIGRKTLWKIIGVTTAILLFSYPAFSYDIFNYIFAAKEILVYHKNPYLVAPQQFLAVDQWVLFMRWIHLPSAYTPIWILLTLPAYLLGFGFFLPILFSMKFLIVGSYILAALLIEKTLLLVDKRRAHLGLAIFALNPLVIVEAVVSPHNDMLMMTAVLAAYYLYIRKKTVSAYLFWSVSVALKLMTIVFSPLIVFGWKPMRALSLMTVGLLLVISQREVLPWYLLWIIPLVALVPNNRWLTTITTGASAGLLLRYLPYIYLGNWDPPASAWKWWLTMIPLGVSILVAFLPTRLRRV